MTISLPFHLSQRGEITQLFRWNIWLLSHYPRKEIAFSSWIYSIMSSNYILYFGIITNENYSPLYKYRWSDWNIFPRRTKEKTLYIIHIPCVWWFNGQRRLMGAILRHHHRVTHGHFLNPLCACIRQAGEKVVKLSHSSQLRWLEVRL